MGLVCSPAQAFKDGEVAVIEQASLPMVSSGDKITLANSKSSIIALINYETLVGTQNMGALKQSPSFTSTSDKKSNFLSKLSKID